MSKSRAKTGGESSRKKCAPNLWEHVSVSGDVGDTFRMPVKGGYLYRHHAYGVHENGTPDAVAMVFVPDPDTYAPIGRLGVDPDPNHAELLGRR